MQLNTQLLTLAVNDDAGDSGFFGADFIPVDLEVLCAISNKLDAAVSVDLGDLKDFGGVGIGAGVNFRM